MTKISCENCTGACCVAGTTMELNEAEYEFLENAGTEFGIVWPILPGVDVRAFLQAAVDSTTDPVRKEKLEWWQGIEPDHGLFTLRTNCGFLAVSAEGPPRCTAYENPERPIICREFQAGSLACIGLRRLRRVPDPVAVPVQLSSRRPAE